MGAAAIYIRWSTEDQGQGTTLGTQLDACRRYCDQQGWAVSDHQVYIDEGYSGGTLYRPAMARLREAVQEGRVRVVVVYRLDRLSRNLTDATSLVDREWKGRAVVRSATEEVLPEKDEGWLDYSFRATFADYERRLIRHRTLSGKLRLLRAGRKVQGGAPFGWRLTATPGALEADPGAAEMVHALFAKCAYENMGGPALAQWANRQGIRAPQSERWRSSTVIRLVRNPIYAGRLVFGRRRRLKKSKHEPGPWTLPPESYLEVEADPACLPPIIPRELWEHAQTALECRRQRFPRGRAVTHPALLTGLLFCPCGGSLRPKQRRAGTHSFRYYRCWQRAEAGHRGCAAAYIDAAALEHCVEADFLAHVRAADIIGSVRAALERQQDRAQPALRAQSDQLRLELAALERQLARIDQEYLRETLTIAEARRLRAAVAGDRAAKISRTAQVEQMLRAAADTRRQVHALASRFGPAERWHILTVLEKKAVLAHFIRRIEGIRRRGSGICAITVDWAVAAEGPVPSGRDTGNGGRIPPHQEDATANRG